MSDARKTAIVIVQTRSPDSVCSLLFAGAVFTLCTESQNPTEMKISPKVILQHSKKSLILKKKSWK